MFVDELATWLNSINRSHSSALVHLDDRVEIDLIKVTDSKSNCNEFNK